MTAWQPWLLAVGMFAIYALTLDHWFSAESLGTVARVSGLTWHSEITGPVTWLATWPFHWLPARCIPLVLNLFAAGCAVVCLAWLARSVALLPQDRTRAQRRHQGGAIRSSWMPPALAVLVCGLQLSFWRHATSATGEMLDLLLFAGAVRCLLETRAESTTIDDVEDRAVPMQIGTPQALGDSPTGSGDFEHGPGYWGRNWWLLSFAFIYGLAVANNWAMAAFAPLFLLALLWAKQINFFDLRFLHRLVKQRDSFQWSLLGLVPACFLAGLSLFLTRPLLTRWSGHEQTSFGLGLRLLCREYKDQLLSLPPLLVAILCLVPILPVVFLAIRWGRLSGGRKSQERKITSGMFHGMHALFLVFTLWQALDGFLSPRGLGLGLMLPCLPLYYLGALAAGYYSSYFLLVFGTPSHSSRSRLSQPEKLLKMGLVTAVWAAALAVPAGLVWKNLPDVLGRRMGPLASYATDLERTLPPKGAIILSSDPFRLYGLEEALIRHDRLAQYLPVNISLLQNSAYFEHLRQNNPKFDLALPASVHPTDLTNSLVTMQVLRKLAQQHKVYCLHPVFGLMGEFFKTVPRGLFYELNPDKPNPGDAPPLPAEALTQNQAFWQAAESGTLTSLIRRIQPPTETARRSRLQRLRKAAHIESPTDEEARQAGSYYSQSLDYWGVELQKAGQLSNAARYFSLAVRLNPDNAAARINLECNQHLQADKAAPWQPPAEIEARLGNRHNCEQVLAIDGPLDDPGCCSILGSVYARLKLQRQAIEQFQRVQVLSPSITNAAVRLGESFWAVKNYSNALAEANLALGIDPNNAGALYLKASTFMETKAWDQAIPPFTALLALQPANTAARQGRAVACLRARRFENARQDFETLTQTASSASVAYFGLGEVAYRQKDSAELTRCYERIATNAPTNSPVLGQLQKWLKELKAHPTNSAN